MSTARVSETHGDWSDLDLDARSGVFCSTLVIITETEWKRVMVRRVCSLRAPLAAKPTFPPNRGSEARLPPHTPPAQQFFPFLDFWSARGLFQLYVSALLYAIVHTDKQDDFSRSVMLYRVVASAGMAFMGTFCARPEPLSIFIPTSRAALARGGVPCRDARSPARRARGRHLRRGALRGVAQARAAAAGGGEAEGAPRPRGPGEEAARAAGDAVAGGVTQRRRGFGAAPAVRCLRRRCRRREQQRAPARGQRGR